MIEFLRNFSYAKGVHGSEGSQKLFEFCPNRGPLEILIFTLIMTYYYPLLTPVLVVTLDTLGIYI